MKVILSSLSVIGSDVSGREETSTSANLSSPPVLVRAICHSNDIASLEFQFSGLLRREVVQSLHQELCRRIVESLLQIVLTITKLTSSGTMSRSLMSCDRETDVERW